MEVSKKLKQLMKVLLVVLMSLTMIVPEGLVKAEKGTITTDKDVYEVGDAIYVTATTDIEKSWVSLLSKDDEYNASSWYWYYLKDYYDAQSRAQGRPFNIYDGVCSSRDGYSTAWNLPAGEYKVVIFHGDYEMEEEKLITIVAGTTPEALTIDKNSFARDEAINVNLVSHNTRDTPWIELYKGDTRLTWFYFTGHNGTIDFSNYFRDYATDGVYIDPGTYKIVYYNNDAASEVVGTVEFEVTEEILGTTTIKTDKEGTVPQYKYGEPVMVTATSSNKDAWVGLYTYGADGFDDYSGRFAYFYVNDITGPIDIVEEARKNGNILAPGRYRMCLVKPRSGNPMERDRLAPEGSFADAKFEIIATYDDENVVWALSEDETSATITFKRLDDATQTVTYPAVLGTKYEKTAAACEVTGIDAYPVSFSFDDETRLITTHDTEDFTGEIEIVTPALEHEWSAWSYTEYPNQERKCSICGKVDTRTLEEHDHVIEHHDAIEPTCTEKGNTEYYQCSVCGIYFSDAAGESEIDWNNIEIAALGHDYGEWTFNEEKHNHYKDCSRCSNRIEEECYFVDSKVGGSVVHTCSVCGGSYEDKFFWVEKTEFKQFEPMIVHVDLSVVTKYANLDTNMKKLNPDSAWVGLYDGGLRPAENISTRWHYVKNMGTPEEGLDMLLALNYGGEETENGGPGSGSTNGYNYVLSEAGNVELYLLADGGYDKIIAHLTVRITEETLPAGEIVFEFNGKEQKMEQRNEFVLPVTEMNFKVSAEEPYGAWVGVYKAEYEKEFDFASIESNTWWYVSDINGQVKDLKNICGEPGKYTLVVYGTGAHNDIRNLIYIEVTKAIIEEKITIEPTCTSAGSKHVKYSDNTEEDLPIPALGHDWSEFKFDDEEAKTHTKECSRCHEKVTEECTFTSEEKDGIITYTCEVCGGQYTYKKTVADEDVYRTSGPNRYFTALKAAAVFMEKTGKDKLDTVVLACGSNFADALAGSYLAAVKNAPILLIDDNDKAATVENFIKENVVAGGTVYILGGDKAVAPKFESDLKKAGLTVKRLKGDNRYGTNLEILKEAGIEGDTILVSVGNNFADSLSASATGLPVLLVKDALTKEQKDYLSNFSGKKIYILGGTNAVNRTVEGEMGEYGTVKRIQGNNRYETTTKIAETFFPDADRILLAVGDNFPDGLCGGALAYQLHAPVVLVANGRTDFAKKFVEKNSITKAVVLGGENALKNTLVNEILGRDPKAEIKEYE